MLVSFISFVVSLTTCYGWDQHYGYDTGTSEYIHSNDTMVLSLYENTILKVSSGSRHDLEFVFQNRASPSHFTFMYVSMHNLLNKVYFYNKIIHIFVYLFIENVHLHFYYILLHLAAPLKMGLEDEFKQRKAFYSKMILLQSESQDL